MIIVEGPDGSGKSTLVSTLLDDFSELIAGKRTGHRDRLYVAGKNDVYFALGEAAACSAPQVWDRLFFSELIYGPVMRGRVVYNLTERQYVMRTLQYLRVPVIVCMPPRDVLQENVKVAAQMAGVNDKTEELYRRYRVVMSSMPNVTYHDYTQGLTSYRRVNRAISDYLIQHRHGRRT